MARLRVSPTFILAEDEAFAHRYVNMTRDDWTLISVRVLGLYLIANYLAPFIAAVSTLIIVLSQNQNLHAMPTTTWQSPLITTLCIIIGCVLVTNSRAIATALQKSDKKK